MCGGVTATPLKLLSCHHHQILVQQRPLTRDPPVIPMPPVPQDCLPASTATPPPRGEAKLYALFASVNGYEPDYSHAPQPDGAASKVQPLVYTIAANMKHQLNAKSVAN